MVEMVPILQFPVKLEPPNGFGYGTYYELKKILRMLNRQQNVHRLIINLHTKETTH